MGKRLLVLGAGGHGKVVREVALSLMNTDGKPVYEVVDFLDDNSEGVIGKIVDLDKYRDRYSDVICGIGNNTVRKQLLDQAEELGYDAITTDGIHLTQRGARLYAAMAAEALRERLMEEQGHRNIIHNLNRRI